MCMYKVYKKAFTFSPELEQYIIKKVVRIKSETFYV